MPTLFQQIPNTTVYRQSPIDILAVLISLSFPSDSSFVQCSQETQRIQDSDDFERSLLGSSAVVLRPPAVVSGITHHFSRQERSSIHSLRARF